MQGVFDGRLPENKLIYLKNYIILNTYHINFRSKKEFKILTDCFSFISLWSSITSTTAMRNDNF